MVDFRQCSREFLTEFIELYQSSPCIWRIKSKEYSDRNKKYQAYEVLVEKLKEIDATATRETVVQKINCLRSVYRKELAKVNNSHRSGAGEDDVYKPSLWYFDLMNFLADQERTRKSKSTIDEDESTIDEVSGQELQEGAHASDADASTPSKASATPVTETSTPCSASMSSSRNDSRLQSSTRKRKAVANDDGTAGVMALVGKKLESLQAEDAFQVLGKHVANKLRNVHNEQNIIAQKLISDVLFEAEMGSLTKHFEVAEKPGQPQVNFGVVNAQSSCPPNMSNQWGMPHTQGGQYQSFSRPMLHHYIPGREGERDSTPTQTANIPEELRSQPAYNSIADYVTTFQGS